MILIDYSAIAVSTIVAQNMAVEEDLVRHMILNNIRLYTKKYRPVFGQTVICVDAAHNWRRDVFPEYKFKRKDSREKSKLDWVELYRIIDMVLQELRDFTNYPIVKVDRCEADDVIGELARYTHQDETNFFGDYDPVMIISGDKDFAQLQVMDNVKQYSNMTKKMIEDKTPSLNLVEMILRGDTSDGVPNCLSANDCFATGTRQTTLSAKKLKVLMEDPKAYGDDIYNNILRNKRMIDLAETPEDLKLEIINTFIEERKTNAAVKDKSALLEYLISKRCRLLIECIEDF